MNFQKQQVKIQPVLIFSICEIFKCKNSLKVSLYENSNLFRIFRLRWSTKCLDSDFRGSERNFTIGQSPKIWAKFSKICIKINKNVKNYWENPRKLQFSEYFLNFLAAIWENMDYNMNRLYCRVRRAKPHEGKKVFQ